ncbi:MAG: hypothetical protein KDE47_12655 [Caldilineaceae bacterium]|nr:hypothetical protein [Caldilineaceae bacterium]MCB0094062.1 hypothetical protein [Caldilineaceae bacterium]
MTTQLEQLDRIAELEAFAALEGLTLPFDAAEIVALEDRGFVIDLHTGQILEDIDPDEQLEIKLTARGRHLSDQGATA